MEPEPDHESTTEPASPQDTPVAEGKHACPQCQRKFKRREHVTRHMLIHTGVKPFHCVVCQRSFPRKDLLQRHAVVHGDQAVLTLNGTPRVRIAHACKQCREKKLRCDGQQPCNRCELRKVTCTPRVSSLNHQDDAVATLMQSPAMFSQDQRTDSHTLNRVLETITRSDSNGGRHKQVTPYSSPYPSNDLFRTSPWPAAYANIAKFHAEQVQCSDVDISTPLPNLETFKALVQLYFDNFHLSFPLLHKASYQPREDGWILLLAVAAIGYEYFPLPNRNVTVLFEQLAMKAISATMAHTATINTSVHQGVLLMFMLLLYSESDENRKFLQYHQSLLTTLCRRLIARRIADDAGTDGPQLYLMKWKYFTEIEEERRLMFFTWVHQCLQSTLSGKPPTMIAAEYHRTMPCHARFWNCTSETEWLHEYGQAAPKTRVLSQIVSNRITKEKLAGLDSTALLSIRLTLFMERLRTEWIMRSYVTSRLNVPDWKPSLDEAWQDDMACVDAALQES